MHQSVNIVDNDGGGNETSTVTSDHVGEPADMVTGHGEWEGVLFEEDEV
jgi:hypothetical protein